MPRVVPNQREKFESDEFLKRHSREGEVSLKVRHTSLLHRCSAADHSDVGADDGDGCDDDGDGGDDDGDGGDDNSDGGGGDTPLVRLSLFRQPSTVCGSHVQIGLQQPYKQSPRPQFGCKKPLFPAEAGGLAGWRGSTTATIIFHLAAAAIAMVLISVLDAVKESVGKCSKVLGGGGQGDVVCDIVLESVGKVGFDTVP